MPSLRTVSVALRAPVAVGAKRTVTMHLSPSVRISPAQPSSVTMKSSVSGPTAETRRMVSGAPLLVTVTRCGALSVPSGCSAKVSACGDSGATAARTTAVCNAAGLLGRAAASSPSTRCGSSRAVVVPSPS